MIKIDSRTSELAAKYGANWKTISGSKVLIGKGGKIYAGMSGKFSNIADTKKRVGGGFAFSTDSPMALAIGAEHCQTVASMVNSTELATLWKQHADTVPVNGTTKGKGYYEHRSGVIHFDKSRMLNDTIMGKYDVLIHEMTHAIDYKRGAMDGGGSYASRYKNGAFDKAIRADVDARIKAKQAEMKVLHKEIVSKYTDSRALTIELEKHGFIKNSELYSTEWNIRERGKIPGATKDAAARAIGKELSKMKNVAAVSDLYGGATNNKARGWYGHASKYWSTDRTKLAQEGFANMCEATVCSKAELATIKEYLPTAYKVYTEMVADMTKL